MTDRPSRPPAGVTVGGDYPLGQLARALVTSATHPSQEARERAESRVERWRRVLGGMLRGVLTVGSNTPVEGAPSWATLEVLTGGFATGALLAGGPLEPHERALLASLGHGEAGGRAALNAFYVSEDGLAALRAMLASGRYRVRVPEEGALLTIAWLVDHDDAEQARALLDVLVPYFDRLRFYPLPADTPLEAESETVQRQTIAESIAALDRATVPREIERQREAIGVWNPYTDEAVALLLETVEGAPPALERDASGRARRRPDGGYVLTGGWPCARYPDGWPARARALLDRYARERAAHPLCRKPERPRENLALLRKYLAQIVADPRSLTGRDVGVLRLVLARVAFARGNPGTPAHGALRARQARQAAPPTHAQLRAVLVERLRAHAASAGAAAFEALTAPLDEREAARVGAVTGSTLPASAQRIARRCLAAPVEALVAQGVLPSGDVLAQVLPQCTSHVAAAGLPDAALRRLDRAVYMAFRQRRSLLLLDLAQQTRLESLPWVRAIAAHRGDDAAMKARARALFVRLASLAITAFPHAIVPNKLVQEFRALATHAGLALPFTDELAADIFMGDFSAAFLRAGQRAAALLEGTLYERYYGVPYASVRALDDLKPWNPGGTPVSPGFAALCKALAGKEYGARHGAAANGTVIEQQQIVTTHNLAVLFSALSLHEALENTLPELAQRAFAFSVRVLQRATGPRPSQRRAVKRAAYAWRQMVFYLSLIPRRELDAFVGAARAQLDAMPVEFRTRFAPAVEGLAWVADGHAFDAEGRGGEGGRARRVLGSTTSRHWLLPSAAAT